MDIEAIDPVFEIFLYIIQHASTEVPQMRAFTLGIFFLLFLFFNTLPPLDRPTNMHEREVNVT
jgi:hypothetical protein